MRPRDPATNRSVRNSPTATSCSVLANRAVAGSTPSPIPTRKMVRVRGVRPKRQTEWREASVLAATPRTAKSRC